MDVLKPILFYYIIDSVERMIIAFTVNSGGSYCALLSEQVLHMHSVHFSFIFIDLFNGHRHHRKAALQKSGCRFRFLKSELGWRCVRKEIPETI